MYKNLAAFLGLLINQIFLLIYLIFLSKNIKMSKDSSAKCYQNNKEILHIKISQRVKNKGWLSIEKIITK